MIKRTFYKRNHKVCFLIFVLLNLLSTRRKSIQLTYKMQDNQRDLLEELMININIVTSNCLRLMFIKKEEYNSEQTKQKIDLLLIMLNFVIEIFPVFSHQTSNCFGIHYNIFLMYILSKLRCGFKILKTTTGASGTPLPNMTQYFLTDNHGNELSFWNDIPLGLKDDVVNACIEIPKQRCAKFQVHKSSKFHPFMQDTRQNLFTKQQQLRYYAQFPLFNYGFIPQTWQQNIVKDSLGLYGDDDPIDVCDLSIGKKQTGAIYRAKVLGSFCLIDQGEVDWKILIVDAQEAQRNRIHNISQFPKEQLRAVMDWFKYIKIFDGKKPNFIAYDEKVFSKDETLAVISETHHEWKQLNNSPKTVYDDLRRKYHLGK